MNRILILLLFLVSPALLRAQNEIRTEIDPGQAVTVYRIAIPFPDLTVPGTASASATAMDPTVVRERFFSSLTRDLAYSGFFALAALPPNVPITPEVLKAAGAHLYLKLNVFADGDDQIVDARLLDASGGTLYERRFRAQPGALRVTAHTLANAVTKQITGRGGIFNTQIAFSSNRSGNWEIWLMDWDGANQRRITNHGAITILPSWSPDNERMVYTSFARGTSDMYIVNRRGGGRIRLNSGVALNTSATFSPVGNDIAFVGSVNGNPDIYLMRDDNTNVRRLTSAPSIESTPEWSPTGRQISFTSGRSGSPQIYVMDAEGTNVRRISFDGDWNDDAVWSPDGERIAYTSRVNGRFQIRIANHTTGESRIIAGEGSNEQPTWSPDGQWIAFQSNRSGEWQVYRMRADGTDLLQLTFEGHNKSADWSKKIE